MNNQRYLCYDLKGIQAFIFAVPRLKYICGGSAIIDRFDRVFAKNCSVPGTKLLFAGGGKGAFDCAGVEAAANLKRELIIEAHDQGLDISFGEDADYSEAANAANESYPFLPDTTELDGHPCQESGLYPVSRGKIHRTVQRRSWQRGERLDHYFENELLRDLHPPPGIADDLEFFHNVSAEDGDGRSGAAALGNRNRWAIIAMDGNDIGNQHREADRKFGADSEGHRQWLSELSKQLDNCSREACRQATQRIIRIWAGSEQGALEAHKATEKGVTTVPVRPLLVGGDDIVVLCHVRYALDFVFEACRVFEATSAAVHSEAQRKGVDLWLATGGRISISAGILFAPVTLPLATAIPYAEQLLRSAKNRGRREVLNQPHPAPASIDWESVTEGILESLPSRRQTSTRFLDEDIGEIVELTRRPYTLEEAAEVLRLAKNYSDIPATIRHRVAAEMRAGFWDRRLACGRLAKTQRVLTQDLEENVDLSKPPRGRWIRGQSGQGEPTRSSDVIDALLLLEEDHRMKRHTTEAENE